MEKELLQKTRQGSKRISRRRWSWGVVGNEVRDEGGGLSKGVVIFFQPDLEAPISSQCIEVA